MEMTESDRAEGLLRSRTPRDGYHRQAPSRDNTCLLGRGAVRSGSLQLVWRKMEDVLGTRRLSQCVNNCARLTEEAVLTREGSLLDSGHPADKGLKKE